MFPTLALGNISRPSYTGPAAIPNHTQPTLAGDNDGKLSSDLVLLYQIPNFFQVLTRQMFATDEDWAAFVSAVQQRVTRRNSSGKGLRNVLILLLVLIASIALFYFLLPPAE
jgi:hypothetical protein